MTRQTLIIIRELRKIAEFKDDTHQQIRVSNHYIVHLKLTQCCIPTVCLCSFSHVQIFVTHELQPTRNLCPWNPPGKNTGAGCHFLLQGIFLTQGSNPHLLRLLHGPEDSLPLCHLEALYTNYSSVKLGKRLIFKVNCTPFHQQPTI